MENPERPECFRRKVQDRIFAVQRSNGNMNSLHIPVDIRRFPWVKKLAADYAFQFSSLAPFFSGDPAVARVVGGGDRERTDSIRANAPS